MISLRVLETVPEDLFSLAARDLAERLGGPTLLRVAGVGEPLFVSTLLHGNETSGWTALCRLLRRPPARMRPLIVFIGNPDAAATNVRHLPDQPDFNRIWRGAQEPYASLAAALLREATAQPLFAAIDLHNNTGRNPHYSVVTSLKDAHMRLAYLFSDKAVHVEEPDTVLSRALQHHCPSIAVEVGPINDPHSDDLAEDLLRRAVVDTPLPEDHRNLTLYRALARVHITDDTSFSFDGSRCELQLTGGMEAVNFHPVPAHSEFACSEAPLGDVLRVLDPTHRDVTDNYFYKDGSRIHFREPVVPAMYTTDPEVVRQDCLCYLMTPVARS